MDKKIGIPKFRSEKEEAEWWDAHPAVATRLLRQALKQGAVSAPTKSACATPSLHAARQGSPSRLDPVEALRYE